ncbi:MAG: HAD family hydrolase [Cellulomonas sp. 73-92]|uniref:HAD hydrolase family protein n=1 Tax=Cellulomonas sp. 73-92 TaxID=1895740 RepID=UPI00092693FA|nr:HAD hydrolase family protein [Cellulomonas sp. 73-92]OJV81157.1 MAG: HAD family hydrolase [Cellulomonas sp. 73-92]
MPAVTAPPPLGVTPDIRLVAVDLDGSLLDDAKRIHPSFWRLLDALDERGILLCPASGRAYPTLRRDFGRDDLVYVAENGAYVMHHGREVSSDTVPWEHAAPVLAAARGYAAGGADVGTVLCGKRGAYVERTDAPFLAQVAPYYAQLAVVDDLLAVRDDEVLKVAVYDFGSAERGVGAALAPLDGPVRVLVSQEHWVDVMSPTADKGTALAAVQRALGVTRGQTMAFGDYLNDLGLLAAAEWSFAMDNAHPAVRAAARFVAPGNNDNGVVRTIVASLGLTGVLAA